jgi:hypothetical protein
MTVSHRLHGVFAAAAAAICVVGISHAEGVDGNMFSAGFNSEFGFTLGAEVDPKRNRYVAAKSQDNSNLYFTVPLPKPHGPFEQVVIGVSPRSHLIVNVRARREFADASACVAALDQLNGLMQTRLGVKAERSAQSSAWVFYNAEQSPVGREMSCRDNRMDIYVYDKKLILQGVEESLEEPPAK